MVVSPIMLLSTPHIPPAFMGEEYGESRPFYRFPWGLFLPSKVAQKSLPIMQENVPDPNAPERPSTLKT
ncbi:hypothetical protein KCP75_07515 [Salmonella enterica subsp. enterica]|nr:hypothetical protein KCP75_07515 [Salmonella enterica subsp. enterica]